MNSCAAIDLAVYNLLGLPEQFQLLKSQSDMIGSAVDELLRFDSILQCYHTKAKGNEFELKGRKIVPGQKIYLIVAGANRDPRKFYQPDQLDITRCPNTHLSFGAGIHYCMGAHLGKIEMEVAISTLLERLPKIKLNKQGIVWSDVYTIRNIKELPVIF